MTTERSLSPFGARRRMRKLRALTHEVLEPLPAEFEEEPAAPPGLPNPPAPAAVPGVEGGNPKSACSPEQSPPPRSAGPDVCLAKSGSAIGRPCPVPGSGLVVSAVATITQPRSSTPLVKKSPRRRSSPVASHVVPLWQIFEFCEIARPAAFAETTWGEGPLAPRIEALYALMSAFWQPRSTTLFVWYQTTLMLPGSPAVTHGHSTRLAGGEATVIGWL